MELSCFFNFIKFRLLIEIKNISEKIIILLNVKYFNKYIKEIINNISEFKK